MAVIDIERITKQAVEVQYRRVLLTVIATVLYGAGWLVAKGIRLLLTVIAGGFYWLGRAVAWSYIAFRMGFMDGMRPSGRIGPA